MLVGENNVGKTSLLQALSVFFGTMKASEDDLYVALDGKRAQRFEIDVRIEPESGLEFNDAVRTRIGPAVQLSNGTAADFYAIRAIGKVNPDGSGVLLERRFLRGWPRTRDDAQAVPLLPEHVRQENLELVAFFLLDARRDLVEDLRNRRSHWGRVLADVGIPEADRLTLEATLAQLGGDIVEKSPILLDLKAELAKVKDALGGSVSDVTIAPLPSRIDELVRAVDVLLAAPNAPALPMRVQGQGARSLAAVMVFHSFIQLRVGSAQAIKPLVVAAFEEPEAHLHPQAHRAMFYLIKELDGQKLISTHSPYVARVSDIHSIRVLARGGDGIVRVSRVPELTNGVPTFTPDELGHVHRFVQRNNGEVLFAKLVIIFEGDTEDYALPVFGKHHWGKDSSALGISLARSDGFGGSKHLVRALEALGIKWLLLADGDAGGQQGIQNLANVLGRALTSASPEIVALPAGEDLEQYLVNAGYTSIVESAVAHRFGGAALASFRTQSHGQPYRDSSLRDYQSQGWQERLVRDFCRRNKGTFGEQIATAIVTESAAAGLPSIPPVLQTLFARAEQGAKA